MNILDKWRVKQAVRKRNRELAIIQAVCPHEYTYLGMSRVEYYSGYDVDFRDSHALYCTVCSKESAVSYKSEVELIMAKQEARSRAEVRDFI